MAWQRRLNKDEGFLVLAGIVCDLLVIALGNLVWVMVEEGGK